MRDGKGKETKRICQGRDGRGLLKGLGNEPLKLSKTQLLPINLEFNNEKFVVSNEDDMVVRLGIEFGCCVY